MGTRNLTIVKIDGKYPLANYGQWDGYPSGQGATILSFLRDEFKPSFIYEVLPKLKELDENESKKVLEKIGSKDGWMTDDQFQQWKRYFPFCDRNFGGGILHLINTYNDEVIVLNNQLDFAADSLFCEWAYVIDLDTNTFEVYKGFNKIPLTEQDRFYFLQGKIPPNEAKDDEKYYPVKLIASFKLNELPTEEEFLNHPAFKQEEEE